MRLSPATYDPEARIHHKAEIVARVVVGETVKAVCAGDGFPSVRQVWVWARKDGLFDAALREAVRLGRARRLYGFDEVRAAPVLARMRAGETLASIWADPAMPGRATYTYWRRTNGWFAGEVFAIRQGQMRTLGDRGRAGFRPYDAALADRILGRVARHGSLTAVLAADPELPCVATVRRWRTQNRDFDRLLSGYMAAWRGKRRRDSHALTPDLTDIIVEAILTGASLHSLSREPGMPSQSTLYRWVRQHGDFADLVAEACENRRYWYQDKMQEILEDERPATMTAMRRRLGPLSRQLCRLRNRPGAKRRRAEGRA